MDIYNVVYDARKNSWCVRKDHEEIRCYGNKRDAVNLGQSFARKRRSVQLKIHDSNGAVQSVLSYETAPAD